MSKIDDEIEAARARVERLKEKKRAAEAKERARFADAIMSVLYEIGSSNKVLHGRPLRSVVRRLKA